MTVDTVLFDRYTEHLTSADTIDILTFCEYLGAPGLTGKMCYDTGFDGREASKM